MPPPPDICPNCGSEIPPRARACPACGADEATGWSEAAQYGGLDLPDEDFDYENFVKREFADGNRPAPPQGVSRLWWITALLVLAAFVALFVFR